MPHLQDLENEKSYVKEMFPNLSKDEIESLFVSSRDINVIITKILDNNREIRLNIKDLTLKKTAQGPIKKDLYYPELFHCAVDAQSGDIDRAKADQLFSKIKNLKNKLNLCKDKKLLEYQSEERRNLYLEIENLNRRRSLMILNKSLQRPEMIDLHGLYTKEALMFVSDFIKVYNPREINLVTGCDGNSQSLRPSLINFLREKNYKVIDNDGPHIKGVKNPL